MESQVDTKITARPRAGLALKALMTAGILAGSIGTGLTAASPASAATSWPNQASNVWTNGWAAVRSCPSTNCGARFYLYGPAYPPVYMLCWVNAQWANGNYCE